MTRTVHTHDTKLAGARPVPGRPPHRAAHPPRGSTPRRPIMTDRTCRRLFAGFWALFTLAVAAFGVWADLTGAFL